MLGVRGRIESGAASFWPRLMPDILQTDVGNASDKGSIKVVFCVPVSARDFSGRSEVEEDIYPSGGKLDVVDALDELSGLE